MGKPQHKHHGALGLRKVGTPHPIVHLLQHALQCLGCRKVLEEELTNGGLAENVLEALQQRPCEGRLQNRSKNKA